MQGKLVDELQDSILNLIQEKVQSGKIDIENHFFKEGDFVNEFGASRSSVREAVRSLEVRGFLERVHGRGVRAIDGSVRVVSNSISDMIARNKYSLNDVTQVRRIIEVASVGILANCANDDDIKKMQKYVDVMRKQDVSYETYLEADFSFHNLIIEATQNILLISFMNSLEEVIRKEVRVSTNEDFRPELTEDYHKNILDCIKNRDSKGAEKAMSIHLEATEQNIKKLHKI